MNFFGKEISPLLPRRQTIAAVGCMTFLIVGSVLCFVIFLWGIIYSPILRFPLLLYGVWIYFDFHNVDSTSRSSEWVRSLRCWEVGSDYFPVTIVKTAECPPDRNYVFAVFPHGVFSIGLFCIFGIMPSRFKQIFPGLFPAIVTLNVNFITPFFRDLAYAFGALSQCSTCVIKRLSKTGQAIGIAPGGAEEAFHSKSGEYNFLVKKRKGFIRVALQTGSSLVPTIAFGEPDVFDQVRYPPESLIHRIQIWVKNWTGIAPILMVGRGIAEGSRGPMPRRKAITLVAGSPIHTEKIESPSREEIDTVHELFCKQLQRLFDAHKEKYHPGQNVKLRFL